MAKLAIILLLWQIGRGGLKLIFFTHHSAFSWKPLQKGENNHKIESAVSFVFVRTCGLAVVEAQALSAALVISLGGGSKAVPWSKSVWVIEKKLESKLRKEKRYGNIKGWMKEEIWAGRQEKSCSLFRPLLGKCTRRIRVRKTQGQQEVVGEESVVMKRWEALRSRVSWGLWLSTLHSPDSLMSLNSDSLDYSILLFFTACDLKTGLEWCQAASECELIQSECLTF